MEANDLTKRFTYHPPKDGQPQRYLDLRAKAREFVTLIDKVVPDGREKSLAVTKLEEVVMWANAGIARS